MLHYYIKNPGRVLALRVTEFTYRVMPSDGVALFEQFLIKELSEENLHFWQACNRYSNISVNGCDLVLEANAIYKQFLVEGAPKQVTESTSQNKVCYLH